MALADAVPFAVAHWPLDEASGNALDSIGSVDLTDNSTVGSGAGLLYSAARDLEAGAAEYFSHADDAALSGGGDADFTISMYINPESHVSGNALVTKWAGGGQLGYFLRFVGVAAELQWFVSADGSSSTSVTASTFGSLSNGTWYSVVAVQDSAANEIRIYVNGVKDSASHSGGVFDNTATFYFGDDGGGDRYDGRVQDLVICKGYAFTDADATEHYNSGAGVAFADWGGAPATGHPAVKRMGGVQFAHRLGGPAHSLVW